MQFGGYSAFLSLAELIEAVQKSLRDLQAQTQKITTQRRANKTETLPQYQTESVSVAIQNLNYWVSAQPNSVMKAVQRWANNKDFPDQLVTTILASASSHVAPEVLTREIIITSKKVAKIQTAARNVVAGFDALIPTGPSPEIPVLRLWFTDDISPSNLEDLAKISRRWSRIIKGFSRTEESDSETLIGVWPGSIGLDIALGSTIFSTITTIVLRLLQLHEFFSKKHEPLNAKPSPLDREAQIEECKVTLRKYSPSLSGAELQAAAEEMIEPRLPSKESIQQVIDHELEAIKEELTATEEDPEVKSHLSSNVNDIWEDITCGLRIEAIAENPDSDTPMLINRYSRGLPSKPPKRIVDQTEQGKTE